MNQLVPISHLRALENDQFPEKLNYEYPCAFVKSKDVCDITIEVKRYPKDADKSIIYPTGNYPIYMKIENIDTKFFNPVALIAPLNNSYLPIGTYHLEYVSCSCPSFLRKIQQRLHSLFQEKVLQTNCCRVHTKNFDVYLYSNQSLLYTIFKKK